MTTVRSDLRAIKLAIQCRYVATANAAQSTDPSRAIASQEHCLKAICSDLRALKLANQRR